MWNLAISHRKHSPRFRFVIKCKLREIQVNPKYQRTSKSLNCWKSLYICIVSVHNSTIYVFNSSAQNRQFMSSEKQCSVLTSNYNVQYIYAYLDNYKSGICKLGLIEKYYCIRSVNFQKQQANSKKTVLNYTETTWLAEKLLTRSNTTSS